MTGLGRSTMILFLVFGVMVLAAPSRGQARPAIAQQIAKTYGLDSFGKIEAIRYTFNAELPGVSLSRSWVWHPKTGEISYEGKDKSGNPVKVTYFQSQIGEQPPNVQNEVDPAFYNDQYNLLFPLHAYWDTTDVQDLGMQKLPLGKGSARRVVVKYPSEGGYTPGDTWELFVGPRNRVVEFIYRRGAPTPPPSLVIASGEATRRPALSSSRRTGAERRTVNRRTSS